MKKISCGVLAALLGLALLSLSLSPRNAAAEEKLRVVCSLFPQYDFVRQIAGERVDLRLLLPPGAEAHNFEPRPLDVKALHEADLFIFTGEAMESWAARIIRGLPESVRVVDTSAGIELLAEDGHEHGHRHDHGMDPHIWLDLERAGRMVEVIADALSTADPSHGEEYSNAAAALRRELAALDGEFRAVAERAERRTVVFGGHFACRYLLRRYGLEWMTLHEGDSEAAEPGLRRVARVLQYMRDNDVHCVLHEESVPPRAARRLAEEAGAELLRFNTAHNLSREEMEKGLGFVDIMRQNLAVLERALND